MKDVRPNSLPKARTDRLIIKELADETLVYDRDNDKAHCLNRTAALVMKNCEGNKSVAEISRQLGQETGASVSDDIVWLALEQLERFNLLEQAPLPPTSFTRIGRRGVIRSLGVATIALPLITSIIVPQVAEAQSCVPPLAEGCPCSSSTQCSQGCCRNVGGINQCKSGAGGCLP